MPKKYDIVALGESLIDFIPAKSKNSDKLLLEGNAGGAPANVLAAAAKLGRKTALISRVGNDGFGSFIKDCIAENGVDISAMVTGPEPTTLSIVSLDKAGERTFRFYRNQTADIMLTEYDVNMDVVENSKIFHFGTVSMTDDPARKATIAAAEKAKKAGLKISFDPNYRPALWHSEKDAFSAMETGVKLADFVKLSGEEATLLTGETNPEKAALLIASRYAPQFTAVTLGPNGSVGITPKARVSAPAYQVQCVDTTGAGDAFWGAALHSLLALGLDTELSEKSLASLLKYSNAAGSLATTQYGAIAALAAHADIQKLAENGKTAKSPFL